MMIATDYPH